MPQDSIYNKGEIVRALYAVLGALDEKKRKKNAPENAGKPWTKEDDNLLTELHLANMPELHKNG